NSIGQNVLVVNEEDYESVKQQKQMPYFSYFAFSIPNWQETKEVGLSIQNTVAEAYVFNAVNGLPYVFDNPGLSYSIIRTTFSLLLFVGLLLAEVFFLATGRDRKSTRLNSSHVSISYAVFCLKKKNSIVI